MMSHGWIKREYNQPDSRDDDYLHDPTGAVAVDTGGPNYKGPNKRSGWVVTLGDHRLRCAFMRGPGTCFGASGKAYAAEWAEARAAEGAKAGAA